MAEGSSPDTIRAFDDRLLEVSKSLPKRLRQCASYVAENKERIAVSTVAEMAEGAGVQPSAFMRFCQILGFSGYSEMQKLFRNSYVGGWPDYSTRLNTCGRNPKTVLPHCWQSLPRPDALRLKPCCRRSSRRRWKKRHMSWQRPT